MQENIRRLGRGVVLATDHSVFHTGINDLAVQLGFNPFSTPATAHPSLTLTTSADFSNTGTYSALFTGTSSSVVADAVTMTGTSPTVGSYSFQYSLYGPVYVNNPGFTAINQTNWLAITWHASVPLQSQLNVSIRSDDKEASNCPVFTTVGGGGACVNKYPYHTITNGTLFAARAQYISVGSYGRGGLGK